MITPAPTRPAVPAKRRRILLVAIGALIGAALIAFGASVLTGVQPGASDASTYPPCDQLPPQGNVRDALAAHEALATALTSRGSDVQIRIANPCTERPDAALIEVSYTESASHEGIRSALTDTDGFGVPVRVVKR